MKEIKLFAKLKALSPKKKTQYLAVVIIIAVILAIYFSTLTPAEKAEPNEADDTEARLEEVLSGVEGAGKVSVMISYSSSAEKVPARSTDTQVTDNAGADRTESTMSERSDIAVSAGGETVILKEMSPEVCGVIVVAEGADDIGVRLSLVRAVTTLLDIDANKVEVLKHAAD